MTETTRSTAARPRLHAWSALAGAALMMASAGAWYAAAPGAAASSPAVAAPAPIAAAGVPTSYADLVGQVLPSVVTVRSERLVQQTATPFDDPMFRRFFGDQVPRVAPRPASGLGSGVVVSADGYILTNHHVVEGAQKLRVDFADGRSAEAALVGSDEPSDLAVLKVDLGGLQAVPLGDSDAARVGDVVFAIGNPLGFGQTATMGIVSAKSRTTGATEGAFEDFIQTDASINQGNSGGALINTRGELIGINSQIVSPVGYNIGIGLSIPSNLARRVMDQLVETGRVQRGMLGVTVQGIDPGLAKSLGLDRATGAIVSDVQPGSPAEKAGLEAGDVILALNGTTIDSSNALRNMVAPLGPGAEVTLSVTRDGKPREVTAVLAELETAGAAREADVPDDNGGRARYGLSVTPLTPELARRLDVGRTITGVVVAGVQPDGPAAAAGLREGDVIERVNGQTIASASELRSRLEATPEDRPARLLVTREGRRLFMTMEHGRG